MKKIFLTNQFIAFVSFFLLIMTWNVNFVKSDCHGVFHKPACKKPLIIAQKVFAVSPVQETISGVFPYDDLLIRI